MHCTKLNVRYNNVLCTTLVYLYMKFVHLELWTWQNLQSSSKITKKSLLVGNFFLENTSVQTKQKDAFNENKIQFLKRIKVKTFLQIPKGKIKHNITFFRGWKEDSSLWKSRVHRNIQYTHIGLGTSWYHPSIMTYIWTTNLDCIKRRSWDGKLPFHENWFIYVRCQIKVKITLLHVVSSSSSEQQGYA